MIRIEVLNLNWSPGINLISDPNELDLFEDYMAGEFINLIKKSIGDQRFKNKWRPLNRLYLRDKIIKGYSPLIWRETGDLESKLSYNKGYKIIGYQGAIHSSGKSCLSIARSLEYGDGNIPARPLFRNVYIYMSKNVRVFLNKFYFGGV